MIPYEEFARLRLSQFCPDEEIATLETWEFMDRLWLGEAIGFSEWLRPEETPYALQSLAIDFAEFPERSADAVLSFIGLEVRRGMRLAELQRTLGEPRRTERFADDRLTYEFASPSPFPYEVSCTVKHQGGLVYVVVMVPRS